MNPLDAETPPAEPEASPQQREGVFSALIIADELTEDLIESIDPRFLGLWRWSLEQPRQQRRAIGDTIMAALRQRACAMDAG